MCVDLNTTPFQRYQDFVLSPEMKEEIETKHFEHTFAVLGDEPRCRSTPHPKQVEVVCVSPQPLPYEVLSCDEC